jgi:hypothetical protein
VVSCQTSATEVVACVSLAVSLFAASLVPFFLLVDADWPDLDPRPLARAVGARAGALLRDAAVSVAALLALLIPVSEAHS